MRNRHVVTLLVAGLISVAALAGGASRAVSAETLDNAQALQGINTARAVYDLRKSNPKALAAYLKAIVGNHADLREAGVKPDLRLVFIAEAVKFITTDPAPEVALEHEATLADIAKTITELDRLGVKMEVCGGATRAFGVDNQTLLPELKAVRSGFIAVMGYQNQGYALVPVY
jgi:intracellular sulfur oxidation DsrE/DsrF family protein